MKDRRLHIVLIVGHPDKKVMKTERRYCKNCREEVIHDIYLYDNHPNPGPTRKVTAEKVVMSVFTLGLAWLNYIKVAECQKCNNIEKL